MMKIYTKSGDKGLTSLSDGSRLSKNDKRVEAYGTIDELNANIGFLIALLETDKLHVDTKDLDDIMDFLYQIQSILFVVGGVLASSSIKPEDEVSINRFIVIVESKIDTFSGQLPIQTHFILPGGTKAAAYSHVCRTVCRRAERRMVTLFEYSQLPSELIALINRLSDYFFVLSRYLNNDSGKIEKIWKNTCK